MTVSTSCSRCPARNRRSTRDSPPSPTAGGSRSWARISHPVTLDISSEIIFKALRVYGITGRRLFETWYQTRALLEERGSTSPRSSRTACHSPGSVRRSTSWRPGTRQGGAASAGGLRCPRRRRRGRPRRLAARPDPLGYLADEIADLQAKHLYRPLRVMTGAQATRTVMDGRPVISLSSNNYLGLATHPHLVQAALDAVRDLGVGSGAVRTIAGTMELHQESSDGSRRSSTPRPCSRSSRASLPTAA